MRDINAGVIHEHIQSTGLINNAFHKFVGGGGIRQVCANDKMTGTSEVLRYSLRQFFLVPIVHYDTRTTIRQRACDSGTNAT